MPGSCRRCATLDGRARRAPGGRARARLPAVSRRRALARLERRPARARSAGSRSRRRRSTSRRPRSRASATGSPTCWMRSAASSRSSPPAARCSRTPDWVQILADVLGRTLEVSGVGEGSARGAAMMALERTGLPVPPAPVARLVEPRADRHEIHLAARAEQRETMRRRRAMIEIVGGGLAAAKLVEAYRDGGRRGCDHDLVAGPARSLSPAAALEAAAARRVGAGGRARASAGVVRGERRRPPARRDARVARRRAGRDGRDRDGVAARAGSTGRVALRTLDDSLELRRLAGEARTATVIGGGFIGCEVTASLTQLGVQVTQVVRDADGLRAAPGAAALGGAARHVPGARRRPAARTRPRSRPPTSSSPASASSRTSSSRATSGLEVRSGVVVDERFQTSRPGVYAIGDVAEFYDPLYRRHRRIEHWSNAAYHGTTLGQILAGEDARYDIVSAFFSEEFGRSFKAFGDAAGHDSTALEGDFPDERPCCASARAVT